MYSCPVTKKSLFKVDNVTSTTFAWTIGNFSCCPLEAGEMMRSAAFSLAKNDPQLWELRLYPIGISEKKKDYVSVYLYLLSCNKSDTVEAHFIFSVLNVRREGYNIIASEPQPLVTGKHYGYEKFVKREDLFNNANELLPDDTFTIACEVGVVGQSQYVPFAVPASSLRMDFNNLFESRTFSDVTFVVNGVMIPAHKAVLAARSRVFATMFEHNWEENRNNRIVISDIEYEVLEEMLRYIYSGMSPELKKMVPELLAAADKYELLELKEMCEKEMYKCLTIENAAETLVFADFYSAQNLKIHTIDFINTNKEWQSEVKETRGWKLMMESHPDVMAKAFPKPPLKQHLRKRRYKR